MRNLLVTGSCIFLSWDIWLTPMPSSTDAVLVQRAITDAHHPYFSFAFHESKEL